MLFTVNLFLQCVHAGVEIRDDIIRVLKTDADSEHALADTGFFERFGSVGAVGHGGGMLDKGLRVAEADRDGAELEAVGELRALLTGGVELEGDDAAEAVAHLLLRDLMTGMALEAGIYAKIRILPQTANSPGSDICVF